MSLIQEWAETLGELDKKSYEKVLPLIKAVEDEDKAVPKLKKIERDFEALQTEWKDNFETEDILNKIWRRIEVIQTKYNTQKGYKRTRWELFEEIAIEHDWKPIIDIIEQMKDIESNKDKSLSEETYNKLKEQYNETLPYITTEIGMGYRQMIIRELDKRFRFYHKRMERQVKGDFGSWLRSARKEKGYSLKELENRSGVTASYIHRIEKGARKTPSIPITEKLALALGVPPKELLSMLGHDIGEQSNEIPGLAELISLNQFSLNGNLVEQDEKDMIVKIINMILNEEWEDGDMWKKGTELLKLVTRLKKELHSKE
ncbi:helix-turn-helix domain-containing protein [Rossellomorea marisflavi]|uniref:helix-turn-helix domain-containing protein n=1 Tax=Rossellomorea marisflavi TaxID=189381 RepID=UPI003FA143B5